MEISIITYNNDSPRLEKLSGVEELLKRKDNLEYAWINISGFDNIPALKKIGEAYNIHPLSIEDILNTKQQPKVEVFENYRFLSIKTIQREKNFHHKEINVKKPFLFFRKKHNTQNDIDEFLIDQISIIIMQSENSSSSEKNFHNVLFTFQEIPGDSFGNLRKRILENTNYFRKMGTDYLAYSIVDAVVDEYFLALGHLEEDIECFEDRAAKTSDETFIEELQDTKKYLQQIRRAIAPLKDNVLFSYRRERASSKDKLQPFFQDLEEHLSNAISLIEHYREWLSNIMDVYLSVLSHQTNKVMKVLTLISTIFIPLTFIAGIYGMNFEFMPELKYRLAYPIVLGIMAFIALLMLIFFKRHKWL